MGVPLYPDMGEVLIVAGETEVVPPVVPPVVPVVDVPVESEVDDTSTDFKAEAEKWKAQAQKHEKEWKRYSKELAALTASGLSDSEKAIAAARAEGMREAVTLIAAAKIEAALTGVVPDPQSIVEDLNLAKYVGDDGVVDVDKIAGLKEKYVKLHAVGGKGSGPGPDLGQGRRASGKPSGVEQGKAEALRRFGERVGK